MYWMPRLYFLALFSLILTVNSAAAPLEPTPAQAEGPYYPILFPSEMDSDLYHFGPVTASGDPLRIQGKLVNTDGDPLPGIGIEIWQTDASGAYAHPRDSRYARRDRNFQFYGRTVTEADGSFSFLTVMPAPYGRRPAHIHAKFHPKAGKRFITQFYFQGDPLLSEDIIAQTGLDQLVFDVTRKTEPNGLNVLVIEPTVVLK
ncbi:MAG: hypothetical protein ACPGO3_14065 [Magnetospiraceae bacterium]